MLSFPRHRCSACAQLASDCKVGWVLGTRRTVIAASWLQKTDLNFHEKNPKFRQRSTPLRDETKLNCSANFNSGSCVTFVVISQVLVHGTWLTSLVLPSSGKWVSKYFGVLRPLFFHFSFFFHFGLCWFCCLWRFDNNLPSCHRKCLCDYHFIYR